MCILVSSLRNTDQKLTKTVSHCEPRLHSGVFTCRRLSVAHTLEDHRAAMYHLIHALKQENPFLIL